MQLQGKSAVVTGAASGLGLAIAQALAREGAHLVLTDRDLHRLEAARLTIGEAAHIRPGDVTNAADVAVVIEAAVDTFGGLDILVNSAGLGIVRRFLEHDPDDFRRILDVNLIGCFNTGKAAAQAMIAAGRGGRIINIASVVGLRGCAGRSAYGASKAALINLTQVMAIELASHGITVNAIAPGPIDTPMTREMHSDETRRTWVQAMPLGRYGEPAEIAAAAVYLGSDGAAWTTGQVLTVDGGFAGAGLPYAPLSDG